MCSVPDSAASPPPDQAGSQPSTPAENEREPSPLCQNCGLSFPNLGEFIDHMRSAHLKSELDRKCKLCAKTFLTNQERLLHMSEHFISTTAELSCKKCEKKFLNSLLYKQHFAAFHTDVIFRCQVCLTVFTDQNIYQEHIGAHMSSLVLFECNACGVSVDSFDLFVAHVQLFHDQPANPAPPLASPASPRERAKSAAPRDAHHHHQHHHQHHQHHQLQQQPQQQQQQLPKNLKCFVCDQKFGDECELDTHRLLNHCKVPKGNRCAVCRASLAGLEDFNAHSRQHSNDPTEISCAICRQLVRSLDTLRQHGTYHLDQPKPSQEKTEVESTEESKSDDEMEIGSTFVCHCGQKFDDSAELQAHSLDHLQEMTAESLFNLQKETGPFVCPKCPKIFSSMSALQGHSHIHVQRRFPCDRCKQCFSTPSRLHTHQRRHLGEKDVKCQICDQSFERRDILTNHMKVHELKLQMNAALSSTQ